MKNREKRYFIKQKIIGTLVLIMGLLSVPFLGDATALLFAFGPIGLLLIFTKEKIWMDDYFFEMEKEQEDW